MNKSLRELLWHIKTSKRHNYERDKFESAEAELKENAANTLKETVEAFCDSQKTFGVDSVCYNICSTHNFRVGTLNSFVQLQENFLKTAVGVFGLEYDNTPHMCVLVDGHPYRVHAYPRNGNKVELSFYTFDGLTPLLSMIGDGDKPVSVEQEQQMNNLHKMELEKEEQKRKSAERFRIVKENLSPFVIERKKQHGYAHYDFEYIMSKQCPMILRTADNFDPATTFTGEEFCEFVDGSQFNWGCKLTGCSVKDDGVHYYGRINTD